MAWYKFVNPIPGPSSLISASRYYIEGLDKDTALITVGFTGAREEWFEAEVDESEVPNPESTCSLEEKYNPEGHADCYVYPMGSTSYSAHRWSHDGFQVYGHGFTYGVDEGIISDVYASNDIGMIYDGRPFFRFAMPDFDPTTYSDSECLMFTSETDTGIKLQKTVLFPVDTELPVSISYVFWAKDREIIEEHHERLTLITDEIKDLKERRDELLEGLY